MNNADLISESLKNFWVKMLKLFDEDPGWKQFGSGMGKIRIRDKHPGSATLNFFIHTKYGRRSVPSERRPTQRDPWGYVYLQRLISPSVNTNLFVVRSSSP